MTAQTIKDFDLAVGVDSNATTAVSKLVKAWESKNARRALRGSGLGLMAVSLAACGGSDNGGAAEPEEPAPVDQTLTLTIDSTPATAEITFDTLTGGVGDDTFNAPLGLFNADGQLGQALAPTLQGEDVLQGGAGVDTLNAVMNGNFGAITGIAPTIADIEIINFEMRESPAVPGFFNDFVAIDFSNVSGAQQVWLVDSEDVGFEVRDVQASVAVGLRNVDGVSYFVFYDEDVLGSDEAAQTVVLENANDSLLIIETDGEDEIETLNIVAIGENEDNFLGGDLEFVETINVTGTSGSLDLGDNFDDVVTLNASGYGGDLTIDLSEADEIVSVRTGAGDDDVTMGAGQFQDDADVTLEVFNLGAGNNTLRLVDTFEGGEFSGGGLLDDGEVSALDFTQIAVVGVVTLIFEDELSGSDPTLNLDGLDDLTSLVFANFAVNVGEVSIENLAGGSSITFEETLTGSIAVDTVGALSINLGSGDLNAIDTFTADGLTSLTVNLTEAETDVTVNTANLEDLVSLTVNLGEDGSFTSSTAGVLAELTTITVTGDEDSDFTVFLSAGEESLTTIDLSGMAGFTIIELFGGGDYSPVTILVGSGDLDYNQGGAGSNDLREAFVFVGDDIGDVNINGFEAGVGANRDRLDFSQIDGVNDGDDLIITDDGFGEFTITAADGQFDGTIIVSTGGDLADLTASLVF